MRRLRLAGTVLLLGVAGASPAAQQAAPADPGAQLATLQRDMLAAQEEITRLRGELAGQRDAEARIAACREKNARLVAIGNTLIESYGARYRKGEFLPFDTGRRRLEAELQESGDQIYDNRVDATPRPAAGPAQPKDD